MYARVSKFKVPADRIDQDVQKSRELISRVSDTAGSHGVYYLVDRKNGQTMAVTLWDDERSMTESEEMAQQVREEGVEAIQGAEIVSVDHYEVALQPSDIKVNV